MPHPLPRSSAMFAVAALCVSAISCDSPLEPVLPLGDWLLVSVAGEPLPITLYEEGTHRVQLVADTLRITSPRAGTWILIEHTTRVTDDVLEAWTVRTEYAFALRRGADGDEMVWYCTTTPTCDDETYPITWNGADIEVHNHRGVRRYTRAEARTSGR